MQQRSSGGRLPGGEPGTRWRMASPTRCPADTTKIGSACHSSKQMRRARTWELGGLPRGEPVGDCEDYRQGALARVVREGLRGSHEPLIIADGVVCHPRNRPTRILAATFRGGFREGATPPTHNPPPSLGGGGPTPNQKSQSRLKTLVRGFSRPAGGAVAHPTG